jgi:hypothetical protein
MTFEQVVAQNELLRSQNEILKERISTFSKIYGKDKSAITYLKDKMSKLDLKISQKIQAKIIEHQNHVK